MSEPNEITPPATVEPPKKSAREARREAFQKILDNPQTPDTGALNRQIVQAVQFANAETAQQALAQTVVPPELMTEQASGLLAQSAAGYLDGVTKLTMASKAVLIKKMTENISANNMQGAKNDALGIFLTDLMVNSATALAAATGAMEKAAADAAIAQTNTNFGTYETLIKSMGC